jgi:DNA-damage-inducible protein D
MTAEPEEGTPQPAPSHISPFERIRQTAEDGSEYWSARDLAPVLDYTQWRNFEQAIERAIRACRNSGQDPADHFAEVSKMIPTGKGARRKVKDYQLSRYACYLIIQNADPEKEIVALGQTYFAVQTRRQEVSDAELLAGLNEDQRRLYLRGQLADHNRQLSEAANQAGVVTTQDFAIFHDHGYMGLYGGLRAQDIHQRKNLQRGQQILDHMGATELAANLFRATQTEEKLRREQISTKDEARWCAAPSRSLAAQCPSTCRRRRRASRSWRPRNASACRSVPSRRRLNCRSSPMTRPVTRRRGHQSEQRPLHH